MQKIYLNLLPITGCFREAIKLVYPWAAPVMPRLLQRLALALFFLELQQCQVAYVQFTISVSLLYACKTSPVPTSSCCNDPCVANVYQRTSLSLLPPAAPSGASSVCLLSRRRRVSLTLLPPSENVHGQCVMSNLSQKKGKRGGGAKTNCAEREK